MKSGQINGSVNELITHDGIFHPDEVLATAVLSDLFPEANIFRTRNPGMISAAPGRIVYDVGEAHDPERGLFDHHQTRAPVRPDGTPYSAFGLVWDSWGGSWLRETGVPEDLTAGTFALILDEIVVPTDLVDNGRLMPRASGPLGMTTLFEMIFDFHPRWERCDDSDLDEAFRAALSFAKGALSRRRDAIVARLEAEAFFMKEASRSRAIVLLPCPMPWHGAVGHPDAAQALIVVHPRQDGKWVLTAVSKASGSRDVRLDLPESWAGLTGADLQRVSGVDDAVFCHARRFMAVAASRNGALRMAEIAIRSAA